MTLPQPRSPHYKTSRRRWARIRRVVNPVLERYLPGERLLRLLWRSGKGIWREGAVNARLLLGRIQGGYQSIAEARALRLISPQQLVYCSLREFPVPTYRGRIINGEWDRLEKRFDELDLSVAMNEVFCNAQHWEQTLFYRRIITLIDSGLICWDCATKEEFDRRLRYVEELWGRIKKNGYKSQHELHICRGGRFSGLLRTEGEVGVSIGRHGELLFSDGAHRLALAKLLGIATIPVEITVRHPQWFVFRQGVLRHLRAEGGTFCQPLPHPDLKLLPARRPHGLLQDAVTSHLQQRRRHKAALTLLDVNAAYGFFSHLCEELGCSCLALEAREDRRTILEMLRRAGNKHFSIIPPCSPDKLANHPLCFDIALLHDYQGLDKQTLDFLGASHVGEILFLDQGGQPPYAPSETAAHDANKAIRALAVSTNCTRITPLFSHPEAGRLVLLSRPNHEHLSDVERK